ncbi:unnamed protein product [Paramecium primaurelia]|uniref:ZZ-type domain-containing protein n=1 Tax=Paramecium primaurelia TaxID=5886 RepID=A0A8S1MTA3_PARPR|nr:unnamed protein product [Paramecium primaurelia]
MKIKVVHNNEIHLLKLQNPTLQGIREHIQKIYPNIDSNFTLAYNDSENDQITLSCQEDLQVLVDEGIQTIKIFVVISQIPKPVPQEKMVHKHHTCDGCQIHPIVGSRFKCLECQDYDLCEECQLKNLHNHHKFYKISTEQELEQFRKEHQGKFGHWGFRPHGQGHHGHGPHGHGPHGHGFHGHEAFKQFRELFQDPAFKDVKQTFCSIAKDVFSAVKTEIEKHKSSQQQQQQEKPQEECNLDEKLETQQEKQQETQQENTNQQTDCKVQEEIEQKIKNLIQILQCDEKIAREYVECFKDLSLDGIVEIILDKQ